MLQFFHKHIRDNNCLDFRALRKIDRSTGDALNYSRSMKLCSQPVHDHAGCQAQIRRQVYHFMSSVFLYLDGLSTVKLCSVGWIARDSVRIYLYRSLSQCQHILLISTSAHPCVCYRTTTGDLFKYTFQSQKLLNSDPTLDPTTELP